MKNIIIFLQQHKKQLLVSTLLFIISTLLAGLFLLLISVFSVTKEQYKMTSITAQSASLFLSPYLLVGEAGQSCSVQVFHLALSLLTHAEQLSQLLQQTTKEYQSDGIQEETMNNLKPYVATIDATIQKANSCEHTSPLFRGFVTAISRNSVDLSEILKLSSLIRSGMDNIHSLGGYEKPQHILVLLQNNRELRATGGFLGSYAYATIEKGKLTHFELQDVYVPDGQLKGHVEPPKPIQEAFQQGFWKLRDANWHPDFPQSVTNISWFFEEAGWKKPNAVIAIDITAIEQLLQTIGPIYLTEFGKSYTADEIYPLLQTEVESDFFAGSTKKRDLLNHAFVQILHQLKQATVTQKFSIVKYVTNAIVEKNMLVFSDNSEIQSAIEHANADGKLQYKNGTDYFAIYESNLGINKSNCCVLRNVQVNKKTDEHRIETNTQIHYQIDQIPEQFSKIAGDYKTYIRLYYPPNTSLQYIKVNQQEYADFVHEQIQRGSFSKQTSDEVSVEHVNDLTEIGFWMYIPEQSLADVEIVTTTDFQDNTPETLSIQKQPGTMDFFNYFQAETNQKKLFDGVLKNDMTLKIK